MNRKKIGYYDYTVVLTYMGMLFAFNGIFNVIGQRYKHASLCLILAGCCDMFDGAVASTKERDKYEKLFGIQIDSLSDLVSFGVLPGIFVYQISEKTLFSGIISSVYVLCALIRLAYFNVLEEYRQSETPEQHGGFLGVPVTAIAILLPVSYVLYFHNIFKNTIVFLILICITATGFLTPIKIKKPAVTGKIIILIIGLAETISVLLISGATKI